MSSETLTTIETLLESILEETEGPEVHYKLRTALQLLEVHRSDIHRIKEAAKVDPKLEDRLRELGYIR